MLPLWGRGAPRRQLLSPPAPPTSAHTSSAARRAIWDQGGPGWVYGRSAHHRPVDSGRNPRPRSCGHWSVRDMPRVRHLVALPRPMGALETVWGDSAWRTQQTTPDCWKDPAFGPLMGRSSRTGLFHRHCRLRVAAVSHRDGYHEATPRPWDCNSCSVWPSDSPPKCGTKSAATNENVIARSWIASRGSRLSASSNEGKCRCQKLACQPWEPLVHLKLSRSEWKCCCQKLARQPWEPPLHPNFRSKEGKYRCQKLAHQPWETLIRLTLSSNEGKCRCLRSLHWPLPS